MLKIERGVLVHGSCSSITAASAMHFVCDAVLLGTRKMARGAKRAFGGAMMLRSGRLMNRVTRETGSLLSIGHGHVSHIHGNMGIRRIQAANLLVGQIDLKIAKQVIARHEVV